MLDVRHSIDNMHVKKNVSEATCGTLLQQKSKGKDYKNAREDLKELGIRPGLYEEETEMGTNLPVAATTLSKAERKELCQFLHDLKVPLRTKCGSRTGGWSLPGVMSDRQRYVD
jgi:hypothetical protein